MIAKMIELWIEHQYSKLNRKFMNNEIDTEQYKILSKEIDKRAEEMYSSQKK
jgi:hypothetical protein